MPDPTGGGGAGVSFLAIFGGTAGAVSLGLPAYLIGWATASMVLAVTGFLAGAFLAGRFAYRTLVGR